MLFTLASLLPLGIPPSSVSLIIVYGSMAYRNETCLICFHIPSTYHRDKHSDSGGVDPSPRVEAQRAGNAFHRAQACKEAGLQ